MDQNSKTNSTEIDLSFIPQKISSIFSNVGYSVYQFIRFIMRNIWILLGLVIIGVGIGFFLDKKQNKVYRHEVIVIPNFESTSFLYNYIENYKPNPKNTPIVRVKIEPIVDVLQFVTVGENLEVAKYLSENNIQIDKYKKGNQTPLLYKEHKITIFTNGFDTDGKAVQEFIDKINQEDYFIRKGKITRENRIQMMEDYEKTIANIDAIIEKLGSDTTPRASDVTIEMNSETNDLITTKKGLIHSLAWLKITQLEEQDIIYQAARFSNIERSSTIFKITVPVFLILCFLGLLFVRRVFKKYSSFQA